MQEGVTYQECMVTTEKESAMSGTRILEVQANLPEVFPVLKEFAETDSSARVWRLPSGKTWNGIWSGLPPRRWVIRRIRKPGNAPEDNWL